MAAIEALLQGTGISGYSTDLALYMWDRARLNLKGIVIFTHGDNLDAWQWAPVIGAAYEEVRALIDAGYLCVAITGGGASNWGGPAFRTAAAAVITSGVAPINAHGDNYTLASAKYVVYGYSMGGDGALQLVKRDTNCIGAALVSPATDKQWEYGVTGYTPPWSPGAIVVDSTWKTQMNTAFSAANQAQFLTNAAGYLISDEYASFRRVPILLAHPTDDPTLPQAMSLYFAAQVGANVLYVPVASGGHSPNSLNPIKVAEFFNSLAW